MTKLARLLILTGFVAVAVAVPGVGVAGRPVINDHANFTNPPIPTNFCGVDGTSYETGVETFRADATDSIVVTAHITLVFTATETAKVLYESESFLERGKLTDNGDGTASFSDHVAGLLGKFKIPNGAILKAADGEPLRAAGNIDVTGTVDLATGSILSSSMTVHGPAEGGDFCAPAVSYLTS